VGRAVIAVCNRKGGAGKTTTAVNVAACAAASGRNVLLVDLDTQGHATVGLGLRPEALSDTVHGIFTDPGYDLRRALQSTRYGNLWLLPARCDYQAVPVLSRREDALILRTALNALADFDLVIIDSPPALDVLLLNALAAASWVVIPVPLQPLALEGLNLLVRTYFQMATVYQHGLNLAGIVPTMVDKRPRVSREMRRRLEMHVGVDKIMHGIRSDVRLAESFNAGEPVIYYAPTSRGADDYRFLTRQILAIVG